jgi:hypothetical protein
MSHDTEVEKMKTRTATTVVTLVCLACGCDQQAAPPAADTQPSDVTLSAPQVTLQATPSQNESPAVVTPPSEVIHSFLTALRDGDEHTTSTLLTNKAREETARRNLTVKPPGAPSAKFEIGQVEYIGPQQSGAHVTSTWMEDDEQGNRIAYEVVWALRRESRGWRIAGLAANLSESEPPVFLNFEDPEDMIEKQQRAAQIAAEIERNPRTQQAQRPQPAGNTFR